MFEDFKDFLGFVLVIVLFVFAIVGIFATGYQTYCYIAGRNNEVTNEEKICALQYGFTPGESVRYRVSRDSGYVYHQGIFIKNLPYDEYNRHAQGVFEFSGIGEVTLHFDNIIREADYQKRTKEIRRSEFESKNGKYVPIIMPWVQQDLVLARTY